MCRLYFLPSREWNTRNSARVPDAGELTLRTRFRHRSEINSLSVRRLLIAFVRRESGNHSWISCIDSVFALCIKRFVRRGCSLKVPAKYDGEKLKKSCTASAGSTTELSSHESMRKSTRCSFDEEHHAGGIPRIVTLLSARSDGYTVRNLP